MPAEIDPLPLSVLSPQRTSLEGGIGFIMYRDINNDKHGELKKKIEKIIIRAFKHLH